MRIRDKEKIDRPREKLKARGISALTDLELVQAIIGSGNKQADVTKISQKLYKVLKANNGEVKYDDLNDILGMGAARTAEILSALELARRLGQKDDKILDSPEKVASELSDIRDKKQEYFIMLSLDGANRLIKKHTISIGTLTASLVHPREVFAPAIEDRAASIIVAHNHPSGNLVPSPADQEITHRLRKSGELLGITLLDHIVITKTSYKSIIAQ